jgi:peptidoglycan/xylan/chitin deacetylase (PgdA/CDA1 family)
MIKHYCKRQAQRLLAKGGRHKWRSRYPRLLVLMYHRILTARDPQINFSQPGMVVEAPTFEWQIQVLKKHFELVKLGKWIGKLRAGGKLPERACAITFDDGWVDNYDVAFPILQRENAPATIFLVSDMIGTPRTLWSQRLTRLLWNNGQGPNASMWQDRQFTWLRDLAGSSNVAGIGPDREQLTEIIRRAKTYSDAEIQDELDKIEYLVSPGLWNRERDFLSWEEVKAMNDTGLVEVGSHTRHHRRMTLALKKDTLLDEILGSKRTLERNLNCRVETFCYPNGEMAPAASEIVRDVYMGACTTVSGWNSSRSDVYALKRIGIHQDVASDETAFLARLSGWL